MCFQPVTQGDITGYLVHYNGTITTVTSSTTTLRFTAPPLPDGVFTGTIFVTVTAVSSIGVGPASDPATVIITGMRLLYNMKSLLYVILPLQTGCFCSLLHFLTRFDVLNFTFFKSLSNHEMWILVCKYSFHVLLTHILKLHCLKCSSSIFDKCLGR